MSRSVIVAVLTALGLAIGARSTDDTAPAGYTDLQRALERKFADARARDHATHADDGYGYDD